MKYKLLTPVIMPYPKKMSLLKNILKWTPINSSTKIYADKQFINQASYMQIFLSKATGVQWSISTSSKKNAFICFSRIDSDSYDDILLKEDYILSIDKQQIEITAHGEAGAYYACQSFRQLLPPESEQYRELSTGFQLNQIIIEDSPQFSYRGFMLDEARHFQGKKEVKKLLEMMALLKLNKFHWHLCDDQGWRIEIKKYPKLTETGAKLVNGESLFYSQQDIKEIIAYAAERHIIIIPEIELPGHSSAALASYPELGCTGGPYTVKTGQGIYSDTLCPGKESTFDFIKNVLDEIIDIFQPAYIHIGGDEAPVTRWKSCTDCKARMKEMGFSEPRQLQTYFFNKAASYLYSRNVKAIGWNDALNQNLDDDIIIQYWLRGKKKIIQQLREGRKIIMSDFTHTYLDYDYRLHPLKKVYGYNPIPKEVEREFHSNILGIEAPLWTERVDTSQRLDWQIFPRLIAHAETAWSLKSKSDYHIFLKRLKTFLKRLDLLGIRYAGEDLWDPSRLSVAVYTVILICKMLFFAVKTKINYKE